MMNIKFFLSSFRFNCIYKNYFSKNLKTEFFFQKQINFENLPYEIPLIEIFLNSIILHVKVPVLSEKIC